VVYWAVGNEMYGSWQLGHMPLEEYVKKHNRVAEAMRAVDPEIRLVAVGSTGRWSETMLRECADHMDLISEHIYAQERPGLLGHTGWLAEMIRWKAEAHRNYLETIPGLRERKIPVAMDEWNYWYGPYVFGELGVRYFLKDALGVACALHEFIRNSDLYYMANYAQTVNVIGAIKTTRTDAALETTGLVLMLYRHYFGSIPVAVRGSPEPLDVAAAWTEDRSALTVGVVNPTMEKVKLPWSVEGAALSGEGMRYWITGAGPEVYNEPGKKPEVVIQKKRFTRTGEKLDIPALSVCLYVFEKEGGE
jgi:alpha-N-arabinofuranosidase